MTVLKNYKAMLRSSLVRMTILIYYIAMVITNTIL